MNKGEGEEAFVDSLERKPSSSHSMCHTLSYDSTAHTVVWLFGTPATPRHCVFRASAKRLVKAFRKSFPFLEPDGLDYTKYDLKCSAMCVFFSRGR